MVKANHGKDIKLEDIPFDDEKTYSLISRGLIAGLVFNLKPPLACIRVVTQMKPDNFEQFTTIPALYRPGPLESGTMQDFIDRKNRLKPVQYIPSIP